MSNEKSRPDRMLWILALATLSAGCFDGPREVCRSASDCAEASVCTNGTCEALSTGPGGNRDAGVDGGDSSVLEAFSEEWLVEEAYDDGQPRALYIGPNDAPYMVIQPSDATSTFVPAIAYRQNGAWESETLGREFMVSCLQFRSIAGGAPRRVYFQDGGKVYFAEKGENTYDIYPLQGSHFDCPTGNQAQAVLTADGTLHMVSVHERAVTYITWDGNRSEVNLVFDPIATLCDETEMHCTARLEIEIDSTGQPHILFQKYFPWDGSLAEDATYVRKLDGVWESETLPSVAVVGLALSPSDEPTFCSLEEGAVLDSTTARCKRKRAGAWETADLFVNKKNQYAGIFGVHESADGVLAVLLLEESRLQPYEKRLIWARWDGSSWTNQVALAADENSIPGGLRYWPVTEFDSEGTPHLAVSLGGKVFYARPKN